MYIIRNLERELKDYLHRREILAIVGPRQAGKSTMLQHIFKQVENAAYLDFEDHETLELFDTDIKEFAEIHKEFKYIFIDEFQYAKEGGKHLKYLYDHTEFKLIITGSSASELTINSIRFLVGRVLVFHLFPLSFDEFLQYKNPQLYITTFRPSLVDKYLPIFFEFCIYGGYPAVVLTEKKKDKEFLLKNIYNTYFLREIKETFQLADDYKFARLLKGLALQTSDLINYQELAELSGVRNTDVPNYLNILEMTFVCQLSRPYYTNKRRELAKTPEVFFFDNGLRNSIIKNFQQLDTRVDKGKLYENYVATELLKLDVELKYWRTKSQAEVDFIVETDRLLPIEVKSDLKKTRFSRSFISFLEHYKPQNGLVLTEQLYGKRDNVLFRPLFLIRKEIKKLLKNS